MRLPVMRPARIGPMPSTSRRRSGSASMTSNIAEGAQELLGIDRANATDHPRGEVLLDTLGRGGRRGLEEPGFELLTVGTVVDPVAGGRNPLPGRNRGGMADQGDQLALATSLNSDDAKAILGVLVGDALDQSGEHSVIG